jgi:hypothetical protein
VTLSAALGQIFGCVRERRRHRLDFVGTLDDEGGVIPILPVYKLMVFLRMLFSESVLNRHVLAVTHPVRVQLLRLLVWYRVVSELDVASLRRLVIASLLEVGLLMYQLCVGLLLMLCCKGIISNTVPLNVTSNCNLIHLAVLI